MTPAEKLTTIAENTPKVYEAGKKAEYDAFWDARQRNGAPVSRDCDYMFAGATWTKETCVPKYDIVPKQSTYMMFARNPAVTDLREWKKANGEKVNIDFSQTKELQYTFYLSNVTYVETLDTTSSNSIANLFQNSPIKTVELLKLKENGSQIGFGSWFTYCSSLTDLTIEGTIGFNGTSITSPNLSKASIISVINALSNTTANGNKITLSKTAVTKAFGSVDNAEWQALVATKPNWTIALA